MKTIVIWLYVSIRLGTFLTPADVKERTVLNAILPYFIGSFVEFFVIFIFVYLFM